MVNTQVKKAAKNKRFEVMFFQPLPGHFDVDGNFVLCRDFGVGTTAPDGLGMTLDRVALPSHFRMDASEGSCFTDQPNSAASPRASHWAYPALGSLPSV